MKEEQEKELKKHQRDMIDALSKKYGFDTSEEYKAYDLESDFKRENDIICFI
jgi:hypothetical protein